ncbi:hypothetical protein ZWY2020_020051 [Hordeum vulgare]|nr:hypothetical protein ZWY2020_020051 [Hordeum vulgare]
MSALPHVPPALLPLLALAPRGSRAPRLPVPPDAAAACSPSTSAPSRPRSDPDRPAAALALTAGYDGIRTALRSSWHARCCRRQGGEVGCSAACSLLATRPWFMSLPSAEEVRQVQTNMLRELFPEETLSKEGFEILSGLLACNPDKWLTAAAALNLP